MDEIEKRKRHRIACKKWYEKNKDKRKRYKKQYDLDNKEKIREYGFKLRAKPEYKERVKKWREEHKEHLKQYNQSPERKAKKKISDKRYLKKHRKKINEYHREYRKKNKEKVDIWYKKYNSSEKGKRNWTKQNHLRLSKKYGNKFKLSQEEIRDIFERDKKCIYCGESRHLELDHIRPISKNGKSIYNNFVVACRSCNSSKGSKNIFEWCKDKGIKVPKIILNLLSNNVRT